MAPTAVVVALLLAQCRRDSPVTVSDADVEKVRADDLAHLAKREIDPAAVHALDGGACKGKGSTQDGVAEDLHGKCIDFGTPWTILPAEDGSHSHTPMTFLPPVSNVRAPAAPEVAQHAAKLRAAVLGMQFPAMCPKQGRGVMYYHTLPQVGFGSVIEYATMHQARALAIQTQFRVGAESSVAWASSWFCGPERSLACYFNMTSCCAPVQTQNGQPLILARRRDPINTAARGFNEYGSMWVYSQLTYLLFENLTPHTRKALAERRATTLATNLRSMSTLLPPRHGVGDAAAGASRPLVIGMHIRRGDSCSNGRYCPKNLTSSYFAAAAQLRATYGANHILLATDDGEAASMCAQRHMGFVCTTQSIERSKFLNGNVAGTAGLIENRVAQHDQKDDPLSGSAVSLDALADIDMLADADMFVLLFRSCFARVAYGLALARNNRPPPVISLEAPWSPSRMGKLAGGKMLGRKMDTACVGKACGGKALRRQRKLGARTGGIPEGGGGGGQNAEAKALRRQRKAAYLAKGVGGKPRNLRKLAEMRRRQQARGDVPAEEASAATWS